jgi:3-keto-disaccharide hydrolase
MAIAKRYFIVAVFVSFLLWIPAWAPLAGTFSDNFDDGDMVGWKPNIAAGIFVVDGELRFKGADSLIVKLGESFWKDYSLDVRVKIAEFVRGGWSSIRTLQNNVGDATGYYEFQLSQSAVFAALYTNKRCVESFRVPMEIDEKAWYDVKIRPSNGKMSFYLDGVLIAQLADVGLSGYLDMASTKGTHVYMDDVVISGPNIPSTGPSGPNSFAVTPRSKLISTWAEIKTWNTGTR